MALYLNKITLGGMWLAIEAPTAAAAIGATTLGGLWRRWWWHDIMAPTAAPPTAAAATPAMPGPELCTFVGGGALYPARAGALLTSANTCQKAVSSDTSLCEMQEHDGLGFGCQNGLNNHLAVASMLVLALGRGHSLPLCILHIGDRSLKVVHAHHWQKKESGRLTAELQFARGKGRCDGDASIPAGCCT